MKHDLKIARRASAIIAWSAAFLIVFATLSPIEARPHFAALDPNIERFLAFAFVTGALIMAYPRRRLSILFAIAAIALGLEFAQTFEPGRHGRLHDAAVKIVGCLSGFVLAIVAERLLLARRWTPSRDRR